MIQHEHLTTIGPDEVLIRGTRIPLEVLIGAFQDGVALEDFARDYPSVSLAQTYALIAYYLTNRAEVDAYVASAETYRRETREARRMGPTHPAVARLRQSLSSRREGTPQPR